MRSWLLFPFLLSTEAGCGAGGIMSWVRDAEIVVYERGYLGWQADRQSRRGGKREIDVRVFQLAYEVCVSLCCIERLPT